MTPMGVKVRITPFLNNINHIFIKFYQDLWFDSIYGYFHRLTPLAPFKGGVGAGGE